MGNSAIFNQVENTKLQTNIFDLSHDKKLSGKMGNLIPTFVMDVIPGDKVSIQSSALVRLAPTIAPFMHRINVTIHHFFVPNRILWENWEDFITGGRLGDDMSVPPNLNRDLGNSALGSLDDYLGLPVDQDVVAGAGIRAVSAFPYGVYQSIYDNYYRDQNLEAELDITLVDGANPSTDLIPLRTRCWEHDYFTSSLPFTQRGPEAMIPLGDTADVFAKPALDHTFGDQTLRDVGTGAVNTSTNPLVSDGGTLANTTIEHVYLDPMGTMYADLSAATGSSVTELRRAVRLQEWLEKSARGGARYIEHMKVMFGVSSSDKRLQRPEFIGGSKTPIKVSEVLQTQSSDTVTPQGNMSGHAISVGGGKSYSYRAEEHGYLMSIMSIMPESAYQQGIPKHFLRTDKFDYYWPDFAHIGEQAIIKDELVVEGTPLDGTETWGYTPRYAEYKFINNSVHGDFRQSLDFWHLGRKFATLPNLNEDFVHLDPDDVDRIFAVQDGTDNLWCQVINNITAKRSMPIFGTPRF